MEPATHLQFYVTMASAFEMHNSTPLSGLGDRASTSSDGSGVMVDVVVGDTGLELNFVRLHGPVDGAAVTALARSAVSRLPASSLPSSPG